MMTGSSYGLKSAVPHQIWWQLATFAAASLLAVYVGLSFDRVMEKYLPESRSFPSTFNRRPSGYSGLAELTRKVGMASYRWQLPYRRLNQVRGTLFIVQPDDPLPSYGVDQILAWVREGNSLIYLDHFLFGFERRLIERLGFSVQIGKRLEEAALPLNDSHPAFRHARSVTVTAESRISGGVALIADGDGGLLMTRKYGRGQILVGVMPNLCANRRLTCRSDWPNFQLMVNLFRTTGGSIYFDEFCHGYSQAGSVFSFLARGPVGLISFQMALIALTAVFSSWQRFASSETLPVTRKISNLEFVHGLSNTYRRAGANDLVWEILSHALGARLLRALGTSANQADEKLSAAWSQATGQSAREMEEFLARSRMALARRNLTEGELIALVAYCDKISEQIRDLRLDRKRIAG